MEKRAMMRGAHPPKARAADAVVDQVVAAIRCGDLQQGARLAAERDLMMQFGVSRTVVREAISLLASQGLIMLRPGHRPVVAQRSYASALDSVGRIVEHLVADAAGARTLFESRIFLEGALARHAATHGRRQDIDDLQDVLEANRASIGDSQRFYETDIRFHAVLYRVPGNPIFPALHESYVAWLQTPWSRMPTSPEFDRINHAAHAAIVSAIVLRDGDAAERALRQHLQIAWELVQASF